MRNKLITDLDQQRLKVQLFGASFISAYVLGYLQPTLQVGAHATVEVVLNVMSIRKCSQVNTIGLIIL